MAQYVTCSKPTGNEARMVSGKIKKWPGGFSLVEMMIALMILSVSILGLTSVTLTSIKTNADNDMRNTAIRLTTEVANDLFDLSFDALATGSETRNVAVHGGSRAFTANWVVVSQTSTLKQIVVTVSYLRRGVTLTNRAVFYRPKAV